jgi:transmembrane sensor
VTSLQLPERIEKLQAQHAAQWLEVLKAARPEDIAAFAAWCRESPVHIREFLEATWIHHELVGLDADRRVDVDALLREVSSQVRLFPQEGSLPLAANADSARRRNRWPLALAASALLVAAGLAGVFMWQRDASPQFTTRIGEQRTVELADTSVVKLNTDSAIEVDFAASERNVELHHGEAVFKVAPDRQRPFRVHTRAAEVLAIGTQFNVYDRPEGTDVTVLEGRVRVSARLKQSAGGSAVTENLMAGEEARIGIDGTIHRVRQPNLERVAAWSKRRLKFERATLEEIVSEFNRYNRTQLRIEGVAPGSRFYRGIFDADDPGSLADLLERESDLVVERSQEGIVISQR